MEKVGIRLLGGRCPTNNVYELAWPPPEEIIAFTHPLYTGQSVAIVVDDPPEGEFPEGAVIQRYRKTAQSKLPDGFEHPNMVRGAEYVAIEDDDDIQDAA